MPSVTRNICCVSAMMLSRVAGFSPAPLGTLRTRRFFATVQPVDSMPALGDDAFSVAPMMDYTDRHLRYLLRLLSKRATLYTEMVTANSLIYNDDVDRWLGFNSEEQPLVLQLGGNSNSALSGAVSKAVSYGYRQINLNCGCPSDKVSGKGCFGAALMKDADHVAALTRAMSEAAMQSVRTNGSGGREILRGVDPSVTVKCRIGVVSRERMAEELDADEEADYLWLASFVDTVASQGGVSHFQVHARKAVLGGLSPDANRKVPPLKPHLVHRLVEDFPHLRFTLNGGLTTLEECRAHLSLAQGQSSSSTSGGGRGGGGVHGVMLGRAVVARPWHLMSNVDAAIYGEEQPSSSSSSAGGASLTRRWVLERYGAYGEAELEKARVEQPGYVKKLRRAVLRHTANLFAGEPRGAKFRQAIDKELQLDNADPACPAGVALILERASAVLLPETLDAPPPPLHE